MTFQTYGQLIIEEANRQGVDPALALSVAEQESNFNPKAVSKAGAAGLFQLMKASAQEMGIKPSERFEPTKNIKAGIGYLKKQIDLANGDVSKGLEFYNRGIGNATDTSKPMPQETINYKKDILESRLPKFSKALGLSGVQYAQNDTGTMTDIPKFADWKKKKDIPSFQDWKSQKTQIAQSEMPTQTPEGNAFTAVVEPLMTMGSGLASQAAGGLAGIITGVGSALSGASTEDAMKQAADVSQGITEAGTYIPRTQAGKSGLDVVGKAAEYAGNAVRAPFAGLAGIGTAIKEGDLSAGGQAVRDVNEQGLGRSMGNAAEAMGASPAVSTAVSMIPDVAMAAVPVGAVKNVGNAAKEAATVDKLVGAVMQGKKADIPKYSKALQQVDPTDIKTYDDLHNALNDKVAVTANKLDELLSQDKTAHKLGDLTTTTTVGETPIKYNYASRAIKELETLYKKTGNQDGEIKIAQLKQKAIDEGLTVKELNDLAKLHGRDLNAFGADGKAPSGITKQAAENTRAGLKDTARTLSGNPAYKQLDNQMSTLIKSRDRVAKNVEEVNKLKQKINERNIGEKLGRALFNTVDLVSGHAVSGFLRAGLVPRGGGLKTLNYIDLEKNLQKNIKEINRIIDSDMPEPTKLELLKKMSGGAAVSAPATIKITGFKEEEK